MNKIVDLIYYKGLMEPRVEQDHPHDGERALDNKISAAVSVEIIIILIIIHFIYMHL